jgi:hypothetical protein
MQYISSSEATKLIAQVVKNLTSFIEFEVSFLWLKNSSIGQCFKLK